MAGSISTLKDTISLESMIMQREKFIVAFMPDVMNDPPAIVREFEPYEYPHLLVLPEFSISLNHAYDALVDVSGMLEPVRIYYNNEPDSLLRGWLDGIEFETAAAEPVDELLFIHRALLRAVYSRSGTVRDRDSVGVNYEPLIYSRHGEKLPDNYLSILSLIKITAESRRQLMSNVQFGGECEK